VSACFSVENFFNARIVSPVTAYLASAGAAEVRSFTDPGYGTAFSHVTPPAVENGARRVKSRSVSFSIFVLV